MNSKILKLLILLLAITVFLAGCGGTEDVYSEWIELVEVPDETVSSEDETSSDNTVTDNSSSDETSNVSSSTVVIGDEINITKNGKSTYTIVASLANDGYDQGRLVQKVIRATSGASVPFIADYETKTGPEIIVGDTSRPLSESLKKSLGSNEYIINVTEEGDIYIVGKSLIALEKGTTKFLSDYFGYDENATAVGKEKPIPAKLNQKGNILEEYKLVWGDEFDSNTLDTDKWGFYNHMSEQEDLKTYTDERAVFIKDGNITLRADRIDENTYSTNSSLTTSSTMVFKYGYVEMRAKVPFGDAVFPSFWMKASNYESSDPLRMGEIDIFEVFADHKELKPQLHKWYNDGSSEHYQLADNKRGSYSFENETLAEEWHTYGMLWTQEAINFMVDGEIYSTIDISGISDFGKRGDGMECFHDYYYLIMNNYLMTEKGVQLGTLANKDTVFPIDYMIDYVRIYQKDGEGDLVKLS